MKHLKKEIVLAHSKELHETRKQILEAIPTLEMLRHRAYEANGDWLKEVALEGDRLIKVKSILGHGNFGPWLRDQENWPLSHKTATTYMAVARKWKRASNLTEGVSIRQSVAMLTEGEEKAEKKVKREVQPYLSTLNITKKFVAQFPGHEEIAGWKPEFRIVWRKQTRERLLPVAREVWPDVQFPEGEE